MVYELTSEQLNTLMHQGSEAALKAGRYIQEKGKQPFTVQLKEGVVSLDAQVVTEIDLASQAIIIEGLREGMQRFDVGLLGEETPDDLSRHRKPYFWCIDPLDGTLPFTQKREGSAVSIGLVNRRGQSVLGIIYDLNTSVLYAGNSADKKTYKQHEIWRPEPSHSNTLHLFVDKNLRDHTYFSHWINELKSNITTYGWESLTLHSGMGSVKQSLSVLEHANAVFVKYPKKNGACSIWDIAASVAVYESLGFYARDLFGNAFQLNPPAGELTLHKVGLYFSHDDRLRHLFHSAYVSYFNTL